MIGKVGAWGAEPTPAEERCLIAAARASVSSLLPIATYGQDGLAILDILLTEDLPASRISVGCTGDDIITARKIAETGAYVSLGSHSSGASLALALIEEGHADRLLLSSGVTRAAQLRRYDGIGYAHLTKTLLPRLREAGIPEPIIHVLTHTNPIRWLTNG